MVKIRTGYLRQINIIVHDKDMIFDSGQYYCTG